MGGNILPQALKNNLTDLTEYSGSPLVGDSVKSVKSIGAGLAEKICTRPEPTSPDSGGSEDSAIDALRSRIQGGSRWLLAQHEAWIDGTESAVSDRKFSRALAAWTELERDLRSLGYHLCVFGPGGHCPDAAPVTCDACATARSLKEPDTPTLVTGACACETPMPPATIDRKPCQECGVSCWCPSCQGCRWCNWLLRWGNHVTDNEPAPPVREMLPGTIESAQPIPPGTDERLPLFEIARDGAGRPRPPRVHLTSGINLSK
jgi:hypothetical protein